MRRIAGLLLTAAALLGVAATAVADDGAPWHPDGVKDGIQVETRPVPGSSFEELRLSLTSTVSVQRLCEELFPKVLPTPLPRPYKRREVLRETPTERWTYEQISVPLFSDRDYVVHAKLEIPGSTGRCALSFTAEADPSRPPVSGYVRIPALRGRWDIFPMADGKLSIQYRLYSEPGGGMPAFMTRGSQRSTAIEFMKTTLAHAAAP